MVTTIPLATNEIPKGDKAPLQRRVNRLGGIVQRLARSEMFKEYERAFSDATELPVALRPLEAWNSGPGLPRPGCLAVSTMTRSKT